MHAPLPARCHPGPRAAHSIAVAAIAVVLVPGIITPAADRYGPLLGVLGDQVTAVVKDLEVYRGARDDGYGLEVEVAGVLHAADDAGLDRFHYVGYSAGGAIGLAVAARHPQRLLSLVVDEPPTDWSAEDLDGAYWRCMHAALDAPPEQVVPAFARLQVAEDVELPPPAGPPPPWMAERPGGIAAFGRLVKAAPEWASGWDRFGGPVLWSGGDRSTPHYLEVRDRLAARLPQLRSRVFPGTHHLASAGVLQPEQYAEQLRTLWSA